MTRSAQDPLRLAIVGVGHLGRHHARIASSLPGVRCVGVHDHLEECAREVAGEFGLAVLPSLDAVADAADAAVIATPTVSHAEIAARLLERGLDVLIEKPITATVEQAETLIARARELGRLIAVGHVERHNPAVGAALAMVSRPWFVEVHRLGVFTQRSLDIDVVLDLMIHDLQIVRALAGEPPSEIRAVGVAVLTQKIDIANARIAFPSGLVANVTASRVSAKKVRKCRIFAPTTYISIDMQAQTVKAFGLTQGTGGPQIVPIDVVVERGEPLVRELADFASAVKERRAPLVSAEVARDALVLADDVRAAIDQHRRTVEEARV